MTAGVGVAVLVAVVSGFIMFVGTRFVPAAVGVGVAVLMVAWLVGRR